jgi:hypothetical protein
MKLRTISTSITRFFQSPQGKLVLKWGQRAINVGVMVWLIYELTNVGWLNVWQSLPTQPLFYVLFLFLFFQLPLFEVLIYRITWSFDALKSVPVFLMKRVYNKDVLGYSGEVYFYLWARKTIEELSDREIFKTIKDNNIISSIASTLVSILLLSIFFFTDQIKILDWLTQQNQAYIWGGALLIVVIFILLIRFRHFVISMPLKTAYSIFGIQMFRLIIGQVFNVAMYVVVMPETPYYVWFTLLSVEIILTRIPFLPNRDLIYVAMSIGIAEGMAVSTSSIAALTLARSVLNKIFNFSAFGIGSLLKRNKLIDTPDASKDELTQFKEFQKHSSEQETG